MAHHHPTILALAASACIATGMVYAQRPWPATAVTLSVPAAPGGTTIDTVTRRPADTMNE